VSGTPVEKTIKKDVLDQGCDPNPPSIETPPMPVKILDEESEEMQNIPPIRPQGGAAKSPSRGLQPAGDNDEGPIPVGTPTNEGTRTVAKADEDWGEIGTSGAQNKSKTAEAGSRSIGGHRFTWGAAPDESKTLADGDWGSLPMHSNAGSRSRSIGSKSFTWGAAPDESKTLAHGDWGSLPMHSNAGAGSRSLGLLNLNNNNDEGTTPIGKNDKGKPRSSGPAGLTSTLIGGNLPENPASSSVGSTGVQKLIGASNEAASPPGRSEGAEDNNEGSKEAPATNGVSSVQRSMGYGFYDYDSYESKSKKVEKKGRLISDRQKKQYTRKLQIGTPCGFEGGAALCPEETECRLGACNCVDQGSNKDIITSIAYLRWRYKRVCRRIENQECKNKDDCFPGSNCVNGVCKCNPKSKQRCVKEKEDILHSVDEGF